MNRITNEINKLNKTTEIKEAEIRDRRGEQKKKRRKKKTSADWVHERRRGTLEFNNSSHDFFLNNLFKYLHTNFKKFNIATIIF